MVYFTYYFLLLFFKYINQLFYKFKEKVELVREGSIPSTYAGKPWTFVIRDLA